MRCAGKYPREAVYTIASICRAAEAVFDHGSHYEVRGLWVRVCVPVPCTTVLAHCDAVRPLPRKQVIGTPLQVHHAPHHALTTRAVLDGGRV